MPHFWCILAENRAQFLIKNALNPYCVSFLNLISKPYLEIINNNEEKQ